MKTFCLIIIIGLSISVIIAQPVNERSYLKTVSEVVENNHIQSSKAAFQNRPIGIIYKGLLNGSIIVNTDSVHYKYSGNRSGVALGETNFDEQINYKWENNTWINNRLTTRTYTSQDKIKTEQLNFWNNSGWDKFSFFTFDYEPDGKLKSKLIQFWENGNWSNNTRVHYIYNSNNLLKTYVSEQYIGNNWIIKFKEYYSYNSNNDPDTVFNERFVNNTWEYLVRTIKDYDNDLLKTEIIQGYDFDWKNSFKIEYLYNTSGKVIEERHYRWIILDQIWKLMNRVLIEYNGDNLKISRLSQNFINGSWVNNIKNNYNYNIDKNLVFHENLMWDGSNFYLNYNSSYYYEFSAGITSSPQVNLKIFPNPFNEVILIKSSNHDLMESVKIFDLSGKLLYKEDNIGLELIKINLKDLSPGSYLYEITSKGGKYNGKIVKQLLFLKD